MSSNINSFEVYNRYVPELKGVNGLSNTKLERIDFCRNLLNFVVSKPVGDVIFKAVVLAKFSWDTRNIVKLTSDQRLTKKGLQKELCAAAIRVGLVAATIVTSVGIVIGGMAIGAITGIPLLGFSVSVSGVLMPTYLMWKSDPKAGKGVIDVAGAAVTVHSFLAMQSTAAVNLVLRILLAPHHFESKQTWVDEKAAKIVGFKLEEDTNPFQQSFYYEPIKVVEKNPMYESFL